LPPILALLAILALSLPALAEVLTADTVWQGKVTLDDDLLIPAGVTLTVNAGTVVTVSASESTKIDPEYLSHQTELLVRGTLRVMGTTTTPVTFTMAKSDSAEARWAGIIVDSGKVEMSSAQISGAETGLYLLTGEALLQETTIADNHYGLIAHGDGAKVTLRGSFINKNDYGIFTFNGATIHEEQVVVADNRKKDRFVGQSKTARMTEQLLSVADTPISHAYTNETLVGNTVWQGKIRVDGQVKLPPEARLIIMPGTVVEFSKLDSNHDGIGENGILIQGALLAKGTKQHPIIFRSAEKDPHMGDWDSINILGSDQQRNLIEFCQVEQAYRGLHFHFSTVAVTNTVLRQNYRGMQFQESVVELRDNQFYSNKSGLQCRDSDVVLLRNQFFANIIGANLYRLNLQAQGNTFANNQWDGLRIREGAATVEQNMMIGNRFGLQVSDAVFGRFNRNLLAANIETGQALRNTDNIETNANAIMGNGLNGLIIRDARGQITGNLISDNGERGIGIQSFVGQITGNTIVTNGLYGLGLEGPDAIMAAGNWWGNSNLDKEIFDHHDDPSLGTVTFEPKSPKPVPFSWPVDQVPIDLQWQGEITVPAPLTVPPGAVLTMRPGSTVRFGKDAGISVFGRIEAEGTSLQRITFTALTDKGPASWGEIIMDRATGSRFTNCDFSKASWALHSHFVDLKVSRCRFVDNEGGLRLNSGPVDVGESIFTNNRIGIRSFRGLGTIHNNEFTGNETAIFIREKGSTMQVKHNNIKDSGRYAIQLGDFNDEDVDARENWWGGKPVVDQLFDGHREEYIGKVIFEPELKEPITLDWQHGGEKP
jgi:hypothetical protein